MESLFDRALRGSGKQPSLGCPTGRADGAARCAGEPLLRIPSLAILAKSNKPPRALVSSSARGATQLHGPAAALPGTRMLVSYGRGRTIPSAYPGR